MRIGPFDHKHCRVFQHKGATFVGEFVAKSTPYQNTVLDCFVTPAGSLPSSGWELQLSRASRYQEQLRQSGDTMQ